MKSKTSTSNPVSQAKTKIPPFAYTQLAFLINFIIGNRAPDLSTDEVRTAAYGARLLSLLATRYNDTADFYYLVKNPATLKQLEAGLAHASRLLGWSERRAIGPSSSGLCLALAIVLEAIKEQLYQSAPEQAQTQPLAPVPHDGGQQAAGGNPRAATVSAASTNRGHPETPGQHSPPVPSGLRLSDWLQLALLVNSLADTSYGEALAFREVHLSIQGGYFPQLLSTHAQRFPDFSFMESPAGSFEELNAALRRASAEMRGQEFLKGGVSHNGFCFALAMVLVAIRQQFGVAPQLTPSVLSFANN